MSSVEPDRCFVFAVCGPASHIRTLNNSLRYIRHFSKHNILVVTDHNRNEAPIEHNNVMHIDTPQHYTHHQASIWLKTSLHQHVDLSAGKQYCYLDSDVIALSPAINSIFTLFVPPVMFAPDHCRLAFFSPYALNCGCKETYQKTAQELDTFEKQFNPDFKQDFSPEILNERIQLKAFFSDIPRNPLRYALTIFKYLFIRLSGIKGSWRISDKYIYDSTAHIWKNRSGVIIMHDVLHYYKQIEANSSFRLKPLLKKWHDQNGRCVNGHLSCKHLIKALKKKFNVTVSAKWQHWNGGVFLFDHRSVHFLNDWHKTTTSLFSDDYWVTRDQGTLIATTWLHHLHKHPTLPIEFNFIADYNNQRMRFSAIKGGFTNNNFAGIINPAFIHVYHNYGLKGWAVWDEVERIGHLLNKQ
jgi:hypothetical protein